MWSAERVDEVLATYRDLTESAPRELTAAVTVRLAPPAPFLPEEWHGKPIIGLLVCHSGAEVEGDLAPVRALGDPIADLVTEKPYTDQQSMLDGMEPKGHRYYWKTEYLAGLADEFLDAFRDSALNRDVPAVGGHRHPPRGCAERAGRRRRGGRQPRRPVHDGVRWSVAGRRRRRRAHGLGTGGMEERSGPSRQGATTSTSRPPTRTRSVSGRPTAPTLIASSKPRRRTTQRTCSAGTGTSDLEPEPARQRRRNCLARADRRCRYRRSRSGARPAAARHHA